MVTPNTLEIIIEYTLISSILDIISKRSHLVRPLQAFARNQNMGNKTEQGN